MDPDAPPKPYDYFDMIGGAPAGRLLRAIELNGVVLTDQVSSRQQQPPKQCQDWEACRATSAASSFFDPIAIGRYKEEFGDGATGANNPVLEVAMPP